MLAVKDVAGARRFYDRDGMDGVLQFRAGDAVFVVDPEGTFTRL